MMKVREHMNSSPRTAVRDLTLKEAAALLSLDDVEGLPVMENGNVVGIVTRRDILKLFIPEYMTLMETVSVPEDLGMLEPETFFGVEGTLLLVDDIMRHDVPQISPDSSLLSAAVIMEKAGEHMLAVIEKGKLVGILTRLDVCRGFFTEGK
jgi:CBS domain-containing protein